MKAGMVEKYSRRSKATNTIVSMHINPIQKHSFQQSGLKPSYDIPSSFNLPLGGAEFQQFSTIVP